MPDGIDDSPETLDLYDAERLAKLRKGPKGFQNEAGFKVHRLVGYAIVPVVECSSDAHPTPQSRFVSPYELDQDAPELEVADRLACVRIHGRVVVGRTDDIAEVAKEQGRSAVIGLSLKGVGRVLDFMLGFKDKVEGLFS